MPDHLEAGANILQHLGDILAKLAQSTAAAGASGVTGQMSVNLARKMLRQRPAKGLRGNWPFRWRNRSLLALRSEEHPLQLVDQKLQPLDLGRPRAQSGGIGLMLCVIVILLRQDHRLQRCRIESIQIG